MSRVVVVAAGVLLAASAVGCGDGPICGSEPLVLIQSPTSTVLVDGDSNVTGVQTDVRVRTTMGEAQAVTLTVLDADDNEVSTIDADTDASGDVEFGNITVPTGRVTLQVRATGGPCGGDSDEAVIDVLAGEGCALDYADPPAVNDFYAPLRVWNADDDQDPITDGLQTDVQITTNPGFTVTVFGSNADGETELGTGTADADGMTTITVGLGEGHTALRAVCAADGGVPQLGSITETVVVDTVAPDCGFTAPTPGSSITPDFDADDNLGNGVQLTLAGSVVAQAGEEPDTEGESTTFSVQQVGGTLVEIAGSDVDGDGAATADATLQPATTPAEFDFTVSSRDHAGNTCSATEHYRVVFDGCSIAVTSPTGPVTADGNGTTADGAQANVVLAIDPACAGQTVTSDCGMNNPTATVSGAGAASLSVTACNTSACEDTESCVFSVTSPDGITTTAGLSLVFDDLPPGVNLQLVAPSVTCGAQITPAVDQAAATPGVQIRARVVSPLAAQRDLSVTNTTGTTTTGGIGAGGDVTVTVEPGQNTLVAGADDSLGNRSVSAGCNLTLSDIALGISPPADDGVVGGSDGTVNGSTLSFQLCGTVSTAGAAVSVVADGGAPHTATVNGNAWCVGLDLAASPPSHAIVVGAVAGASTGSVSLSLAVDLSAPAAVDALTATPINRAAIELGWTAPADVAAYVVKQSTTALTAGNFGTTGIEIPTGTPGAAGTAESLVLDGLRAGTGYFIGIATVDSAGNRSAPTIVGPIVPEFDQSGALAVGGSIGLGYAIGHGKFNDDDFEDVAVSAPFSTVGANDGAGQVFVYFGSATGLHTTPDLTIDGTAFFGSLGSGVAGVRWSSTTRDDLVVSAPFADNINGRIFVFRGGAGFPTGTVTSDAASQQIGVNPGVPGFFASGGLGFSLTALDFDGDGTEDLATSVANGGNGQGGVVIIYGKTCTAATCLLSDLDASAAGGAVAQLIVDPTADTEIFGQYLFNVGPVQGVADRTDDLSIGFSDDGATDANNDTSFVVHGATTHPTAAGVTLRPITAADLRITFDPGIAGEFTTEWASQATSVRDLNGDGARDLVIGAYRWNADFGRIVIVDGNLTGTVNTHDAGVTVATISGAAANTKLGALIVSNQGSAAPDIDGDGLDDLIAAGVTGGQARLFTWFGGTIVAGNQSITTAQYVVDGSASFGLTRPSAGGPLGQAAWVGDVNGDGLSDICWSDDNDPAPAREGVFEILFDDGL